MLDNLDKEKSTDVLVEKLALRLSNRQLPVLELRNTALALTLIAKVINEKGLRTLNF